MCCVALNCCWVCDNRKDKLKIRAWARVSKMPSKEVPKKNKKAYNLRPMYFAKGNVHSAVERLKTF